MRSCSLCSMVREHPRHSHLLTLPLWEDWVAVKRLSPQGSASSAIFLQCLGSVLSGPKVVFLSLKKKKKKEITDSSIQTTLKSLYPNFCLKEPEGRRLSCVFSLPPTPHLLLLHGVFLEGRCARKELPSNNKGQVGAIRFQQSQVTQT